MNSTLPIQTIRLLAFLLPALIGSSLAAIEVDRSDFDGSGPFGLETKSDGLVFTWNTPEGRAHVELQFIPRQGGRPAAPLIRELGLNGKPIMEGLPPNYLFWIGDRDLEKRAGWSIFFDRVPTRPYSVEKGYLNPDTISVHSKGSRAHIEIGGLKSAHFAGSLNLLFYDGSPFIHMEAQVTTDREATAFLYHFGLAKLDTEGHRLYWADPFGNVESAPIEQATAKVYQTKFRSMALSSSVGSVAISPFPHQFLYPLDFAENYGYNWAGHEYLDMIDGFAWGVRQPSIGDRRYVPWVNAPPGTEQKLGTLVFLSAKKGSKILDTVSSYTRGDSFKRLPGYKTFTSHYHVEHSLDFIEKQKDQKTKGIPKGLRNPEFVDVFKEMRVDIVHLAEFHKGVTPRLGTEERLAQLQVMHAECERLSSDDFLLLPGEEPNVHLGGHWISFFPRPVNWVLNRNEGQPFVQETKDYGTVYHVGSVEDVYELLRRENGLAWTAHARIKGSTGFPDAYRATEGYQSDRFLGAAWKAMPADYSRDTLGWRNLDLQDDMANWGQEKYTLGEVDVFKIFKGYELFGAMNINYLKLDTIPQFEEGWQPVLDALREGKFFVTTGEVLITDFTVAGTESGERLNLTGGKRSVPLKASLEWTYPLNYMEVVSGDGDRVYRERVDLSDTSEFGTRAIELKVDLSNRQWVRIEVWDIARNGAFTQPVWIE